MFLLTSSNIESHAQKPDCDGNLRSGTSRLELGHNLLVFLEAINDLAQPHRP
jgi:hypothetical protein